MRALVDALEYVVADGGEIQEFRDLVNSGSSQNLAKASAEKQGLKGRLATFRQQVMQDVGVATTGFLDGVTNYAKKVEQEEANATDGLDLVTADAEDAVERVRDGFESKVRAVKTKAQVVGTRGSQVENKFSVLQRKIEGRALSMAYTAKLHRPTRISRKFSYGYSGFHVYP